MYIIYNNVYILKGAGEVIKYLRKNFNMTQEELVTKLRVNISSVQKYESSIVNNLKMETIRELFGIPPWILIFPNQNDFEFY